MTWLHGVDNSFWKVEVIGFYVDDNDVTSKTYSEALFDTGTSLIIIKTELYNYLYSNYFS